MILKDSSPSSTMKPLSKTQPVRHTVLWLIRRYGYLLPIGLILFSGLSWLGLWLDDRAELESVFLLAPEYLPAQFPRAGAVLFGTLVAFSLFRFQWSRRETAFTLSTGLSRVPEFIARYLYGVLTVLSSVVLPILLSYGITMDRLNGETMEGRLPSAAATYILGLSVVALLAFAVAVLVSTLCGRFTGALLCTGGILAAPYLVWSFVKNLVRTFLFGSAPDYWPDAHVGLLSLLGDRLCPPQIPVVPENVMGALGPDGALEDASLPVLPLVLLTLLFLAISALACRCFWHRPAEIAGHIAIHPVLSLGIALSIGLGVAGIVLLPILPIEGALQFWIKALLSLLASIAAALSTLWLLVWDRRSCRRALPVLGGMAGALALATIVLSTGGFGYSSEIPAAEEIASVTVSYDQNRYLMMSSGHSSHHIFTPPDGSNSYFRSEDHPVAYFSIAGYQFHEEDVPTLDSPEEIEVVRAIHAAIIADGHRPLTGRAAETPGDTVAVADYLISYRLKDGRTITRHYNTLSIATFARTLEIENTDTYCALMANAHRLEAQRETRLIVENTCFLGSVTAAVTPEEKAELYAALDADYAALTLEQRYFPAPGDILGIIREVNDFLPAFSIGYASDPDSEVFYITRAHTRTLAYLETHGLGDALSSTYEDAGYKIRSIHAQPYAPRFFERQEVASHLFLSCPQYDQMDYLRRDEICEVPEGEWAEALAESLPTAYLSRPGRTLLIVLENDAGKTMTLTRFWPGEP